MFRPVFVTGLGTGLIVGLLISIVHIFTTTPLVLQAEQYESGAEQAQLMPDPFRHAVSITVIEYSSGDFNPDLLRPVHNNAAGEAKAWAPHNGLERTAYTTLANILMSIGFAMLLVAVFALRGVAVDGRQGLLWGIGGFAVFQLAPVLGLPPEIPGAMTADLEARQLWWLFTVVSTAIGLWLMVFGKHYAFAAIGIAILALPHLSGAPHPAEIGGNVPPELAGQFAATSIVVGAIFWAMLGWVSGSLYQRLTPG